MRENDNRKKCKAVKTLA